LKKKNGLLTTGIIGTVVTLVCCFTPVLLILLGAVGLGAFTGYLDFILLPVLAVFTGLTIYAFTKQKNSNVDS
jgi:hypothetical protein